MPKKIGITGGIGTGKSTVCLIFRAVGVPIYDADSRAKYLMRSDLVLIAQIKKYFGEESYLADNQLNTIFLAQKVFQNQSQLDLLNRLVHPQVRQDMQDWALKFPTKPYLLKEAALMYESDSYQDLDKIIVVSAPLELRIERIRKRDPQRTEAEIRAIIAKQMPQEEKERRADFVIQNDGQHLLIPQILPLHKIFIQHTLTQ